MTDRIYDFDELIDRRGTGALKYDFAVQRGHRPDELPMWVADMDFRMPDEAVDALVARARQGIFGYTEPLEGYYEAARAWIERHQGWKPGAEFSPVRDPRLGGWILTPGIVFALAAAVRAYTEPGEAVVIQPPVYYPFKEVVEDNGRVVARAPLAYEDGRYTFDAAAFERVVEESGARLFLLCNPHNPVGRVWSAEELRALGDVCLRHDVVVVSDEIHADFARPGRTHTSYAALGDTYLDHAVICTSPGKTFNMAGLQDSNILVLNPELAARLRRAVDGAGYSQMNTMGIVAGEACYAHGESWFAQMKDYVEGNIRFTGDYLREHAPELRLVEPESTYLLWVDCRSLGLTEEGLRQLVEDEANLWVDFGNIFGPEGEGFIRLNVACPRSVVEQAFSQLTGAVAAQRGRRG